MKFVHIADMHFDAPFTTLSKNGLSDNRRLEQRQIFQKIIQYIKQNQIEYLFICGDLYEQEYVKASTIQYINKQFLEIPQTKIYITPGNHDPYLKNSYYQQYQWNPNVTIFRGQIQKISNQNINIYGYGFEDFYQKNNLLDQIPALENNKINILLTHAQLDGSIGANQEEAYNPIAKKELKELAFDYVALGHIHKPSYQDEPNQTILYPGSPIAMGFDELGKHGMIVGEINDNKNIKIQFIPLDEKEFVEQNLSIDEISTKEELIETINQLPIQENQYYKIILIGKRNFSIHPYEIEKHLNPQIIKLKDQTQIKINLNQLAQQDSLKGIFVKNMLQKIQQAPQEQKQKLIQAMEIGLEAM